MTAVLASNGALQHVTREYRDVVEQAMAQGAELRRAVGRHPLRLALPTGEVYPLSISNGSDPRTRLNFIAQLRRAGMKVGPQRQKPKRPTPGHDRASAWLALQPEDREFTAEELGGELGIGYHARRYCYEWRQRGRVYVRHLVHAPGQRGKGTPVYGKLPAPKPQQDVELFGVAATPLRVVMAEPIAAPTPEPTPPTPNPRALMWKKISEGLLLLAEAAEIAGQRGKVSSYE